MLENMTADVSRFYDTLETAAYSLAVGKDSLSDVALSLFSLVARDETVGPDNAREIYLRIRNRAEVIANERGNPLKAQTPKSEASQVSKLTNFAKLGEVARGNAIVVDAVEYAAKRSARKYTPLVKAMVAIKTTLAKTPKATLVALQEAIDATLAAKPAETLSEALGKLAATLDRARDGNGEDPSPHAEMIARVVANEGFDIFEAIQQRLARAKAIAEKFEKATEDLPQITV